ncbi:recombinase family protein [Sphingomonas sp. BK235]|uniref:recombinase family protein n=1 Tax=Sphingomonas sp. BK235 TaxID=2512131 RepID=UPI00104CEA01|nr:recombinase family protein [Sphingomonas sp. BK235]TCP29514.1 DNA invertase Pin-like site-specific DNA recombinase [Sphingomonas sp. BK235]
MRLGGQVAQATVKAYSYQRFSSPSQANGDSLARQTALAKAYAEQHGLHLDDELTYRDLGVSGFRGKNAAHGELACFLEAVRTGQIPEGSFLLIESLDRLSRDNILRAQAILTNLVVSGVNVVSLADNRLYSEESLSDDPLGLIYALIVFIRANEESATKSMRARQAWTRKRAAVPSKVLSSKLPDWLTFDNGRIVPIAARAELLKRIFGNAEEGQPPQQIAETLNKEQVPRWRIDGPWERTTIAALINNRRVTGALPLHEFVYKRNVQHRLPIGVVGGYFPRIIEPETFLRVWSICSNRRRGGSAAKRNVFANLLRCADCGADVRHKPIGEEGKGVLVCAGASIAHRCSAPEYSYAALESAMLAHLGPWSAEGIIWIREADPGGCRNSRGAPYRLLGNEALSWHHDRLSSELAQRSPGKYGQAPSLADYMVTSSGRRYLLNDCSTLLAAGETGLSTSRARVNANAALRRMFSHGSVDLRTGACTLLCGKAGSVDIRSQA